MYSGMKALENCYSYLLTATLIILAVMLLLCLIRACIGPSTADRTVSVNMMGTMVMVMIAILAILQKEGYLVDICIIYAMISFLAVIVLTKVYTGVFREQQEIEQEKKEKEEGGAANGNS